MIKAVVDSETELCVSYLSAVGGQLIVTVFGLADSITKTDIPQACTHETIVPMYTKTAKKRETENRNAANTMYQR